MKKKHLIMKLFLISSFALGLATISQADLNQRNIIIAPRIANGSDGTQIRWNTLNLCDFRPQVTEFKIYKSSAISIKDFFDNKKVKYELVTAVSSDESDYEEDDEVYYGFTFDQNEFDLNEKDKCYRFKIEAYYGKKLVDTDYCESFNVAPVSDSGIIYSKDLIISKNHSSGKKTVISWTKEDYENNTFDFYLSDAITSYKDYYYNVSYHEYGKVSGEKGEYTIKGLEPGKDYFLYILIYEDEKIVDEERFSIGTMPELPWAGVYNYNDLRFATDKIAVPFYNYDNDKSLSDGFIVYRKNKKGKFVKIADVKQKNKNFIDKNVKAGNTYTYKARSYKKINGKTYYSVYTDEIKASAVNSEGYFKTSFVGKDKKTIKIESIGKNNGTVRNWEPSFVFDKIDYKIKKYSIDGIKWIKTDGTDIPELKAGKSIWFKLAKKPSDNILYMSVNYGDGSFSDTTYYLSIDLSKKTASMKYADYEDYY